MPSPAYLPHLGIEPGSPALQADSLPTEPEAAILVFSFAVTPLTITQRQRTLIYYHISHRNQEATGVISTPFKLVPCVLVFQSCLTLCDLMDCSPPGSSVHGLESSLSLLQGTFPTQELNRDLLQCRFLTG